MVWIVLSLSLVLGLSGWAWHTTRPDYRLRLGMDILRRGDVDAESTWASLLHTFAWAGRPHDHANAQAERLALLLDASGHPFHAHLLQAQIFYQAGQYRQALKEIHAMVQPQFNQLLNDREDLRLEAAAIEGKCLVFLKEYRNAEKSFRYVLERWHPDMDPRRGKIDARRGLFTIYYDQGAMANAVEQLREAARLDPSDGKLPRALGAIYKDIPNHEEQAVQYLTEALRLKLPSRTEEEVRIELAEIFLKQGKPDQALQVLEAVNDYPKVLALRAEAWRNQGQVAKAKVALAKALVDDPRCLEALRLQADLHLQNQEPGEAIATLNRALSVDPHDDFSLSRLARAYEMTNDRVQAEESRKRLKETQALFEEMTRLTREATANPWDPAVRNQLAETCRKLQKPNLAEMWTQAAKACAGTQKQRVKSPSEPPGG